MSYEYGTTHFNLPQTIGSDKRDWSDTNQAFADVDAALYGAVSDAGTALTAAQTAQTAADGAVTIAQGAATTANSASATAASANEAAQLANTAAQAAQATASSAETTAQGAVTTANAASATASNADTVALAAQAAVADLESDLTKHSLGTAVNITAAYTFPSDGYLLVASGNNANSSASVYLNGAISMSVENDANGGRNTNTVFVRKDMSVGVPTLVGSGSVTFYPLA